MIKAQEKADTLSWPIRVVGMGTLAWLIIFCWLFLSSKPCDPQAAEWVAQRLTCMPANEIGDALAGAFAPLAFIWLTAAVFLQRAELAAQRQELREGRAVAELQVEEARKNVAYIGQQTAILEAQLARSSTSELDDDIDELLVIMSSIGDDIAAQFSMWDKDRKQDPGSGEIVGRRFSIARVESRSDHDKLKQYIDAIDNLQFEIDILYSQLTLVGRGERHLASFIEIGEKVAEMREAASQPKQALLTYIGAARGVSAAKGLLKLVKSEPPQPPGEE